MLLLLQLLACQLHQGFVAEGFIDIAFPYPNNLSQGRSDAQASTNSLKRRRLHLYAERARGNERSTRP